VDFLRLIDEVQAIHSTEGNGIQEILISCSVCTSKVIERISETESNIVDFMISLYGSSEPRPKLEFHILPPNEEASSKSIKIFDRARQQVRSYANESGAFAPSPK
jgi:hypothetical protein